MRTKQQIFTLAAALVVALVVAGPVVADCGANPGIIATQGAGGTSQIFTRAFTEEPTFFYSAFGGTTYCVGDPGCTPVSGNVSASFWAEGLADVALGAGTDSGSFDLVAFDQITYAAYPDFNYYGGATINSGWALGSDGCIGSENCMCLLLVDNDGDDAYFALVGARSNTAFTTSVNLGGVDGSGDYNMPIIMERVSAPSINGSTRVGTDVNLAVSVGAQDGVYNKDGCTCAPTGFKVLQQVLPRGDMPPMDRSTGWSEAPLVGGGAQGVTPIGSQIEIASTCGTADSNVYLATQLFFEGGYSTSVVSANSSRVECGTTLADPNDRPRQRPGNIKPTLNDAPRGRGR